MNYISRKIGLCICAVQLIASAVFFVALWLMNLLPAKYVTIIGLVLLLFFVCVVSTQLLSKKKGIAGKVISILLSIGLIFGSYYIFKTTNVIENISGGDTKVTKMVVAVKESDPAEKLEDAASYQFGVQYALQRSDVEAAVANINEKLGSQIVA